MSKIISLVPYLKKQNAEILPKDNLSSEDDRLLRIRASLDKINKLMQELKDMSHKS
jgi:hypothetical protein